ncbi:LOW QUALITY PROTEIN: hypothetical protein RJ639_017463, partial [Escallonia herrerae]
MSSSIAVVPARFLFLLLDLAPVLVSFTALRSYRHILAMEVCSSLPFHTLTLVVTASIKQGQAYPFTNSSMLKSNNERYMFYVSFCCPDCWRRQHKANRGLNQSFIGRTDESYKEVRVRLCYAPINQVDRKWRKTVNGLSKDKTCQFIVVNKPYQKLDKSFKWSIEKEVPTATLAYIYDYTGEEVAYGQNSDAKKGSNLFEVQGISGRHLSLDVASFFALALVSLIGFFLVENSKKNQHHKCSTGIPIVAAANTETCIVMPLLSTPSQTKGDMRRMIKGVILEMLKLECEEKFSAR